MGGAVMHKLKAQAEAVCLQASNFAFTNGGTSIVKLAIDLLVGTNEERVVIETDLKEAFQRASRDVIVTLDVWFCISDMIVTLRSPWTSCSLAAMFSFDAFVRLSDKKVSCSALETVIPSVSSCCFIISIAWLSTAHACVDSVLNWPGLQAVQVTAWVAFKVLVTEPAGHVAQSDADVLLKRPGLHTIHADVDTGVYWPAEHAVHVAAAGAASEFVTHPGGQMAHATVDSLCTNQPYTRCNLRRRSPPAGS